MLALILVLAASAAAQQVVPVNVVPGGRMEKLITNAQDTIYDFTTAQRSRIQAICVVDQRVNCYNTMFQASLDGRQWVNVCTTQSAQYLLSEFNQLKIRVGTSTGIQAVSCDFSATPPYVGLHQGEPDSSEHGIEGITAAKPTCRCGWANKRNGRIVGGKIARQNEFAFPVRMVVNGQPHCGGSIITQWHVLTAAHCTEPFRDQRTNFAVAVGEHHISNSPLRKIYPVSRVIDHENYNKNIFLNDITILVLGQKIEFTEFIGPVCMPNSRQNLVNDHIKIIGWGRTVNGGDQSPVLKKLNLRVLDPQVCVVIYPFLRNDGTKVCTYRDSQGSCQGDSGGPLVWRSPNTNMFVQSALVSFGKVCASKDPSVNTDVRTYMPWITRVVQATSPEPTQMCYSN